MTHTEEQTRRFKGKAVARGKRAGGWGIALLAVLVYATGCGGSDQPKGPQTRTVSRTQDADFDSIQKCISSSKNQDTCLVYPGTYLETRIDFQGKAITVRSSGGPENTTIDGRGQGPVVTLANGEDRYSVLQGFTIRNGSAVSGKNSVEHGGGIQLISAAPTIRDCILLDNHAEGDGGGIYCFSTGSKPDIENVIFQGNTADEQGGALCVVYGGADVFNCLFIENKASKGGAISSRYGAPLNLANCTVTDNSAVDQAGALYMRNSTVETANSIYWNNSSDSDDNSAVVMDFDDRGDLNSDTKLALSYLDLQGGTENLKTKVCSDTPLRCIIVDEHNLVGMLDPPADPIFVPLSLEEPSEIPWQAFYLSQPATLRSDQVLLGKSPCVNAGEGTAEQAGLEERTTRTDGVPDDEEVDLGYHYGLPTP